VTLEKLASLFGAATPIARAIPNTLTDTGFGYSGVTLNPTPARLRSSRFCAALAKCCICLSG
jgi:pyrroline-5-carboxylate reductase